MTRRSGRTPATGANSPAPSASRQRVADDFDTVFYPGGHGPLWDLVENPDSIALIESFFNAGKPVAAVCHSPGVLHRVTYQAVGRSSAASA